MRTILKWPKRLYCALFHFPYHHRYTMKDRTVRICDVCDRNEDDIPPLQAFVYLVLTICAIIIWGVLLFAIVRFFWK